MNNLHESMGLGRDRNRIPWICSQTLNRMRYAFLNYRKEENGRRNYFMNNFHESMELGRDRTFDPWICSQTRYRMAARRRLYGIERKKQW